MNTKINPSAIGAGTIAADKLGTDVATSLKTDMGLSDVATSGSYNDLSDVPTASTSAYGVTKLSTSTSSTSTVLAATASAVKAAYDLANGKQAALVSGTNIKTINGTSILGSGNVVAGVKPLVTFSATSIAMDPNKYYRLTTAQSSLTITFNTPSDSTILNEYFIEFPCTSAMTLTMPSTVKWVNDSAPTFESGFTYQISVVNNMAICATFVS